MRAKLQSILILLFISNVGFSFIPPMHSIVREVFGERKRQTGTEARIKHTVTLSDGAVVEIDERIFKDSTGTFFTWRTQGANAVTAVADKLNYVLNKERSLTSRSSVFWKYLLDDSAEGVRDALVAERFIRRDHFYQYKPGFNPEGEPSTWSVKENYLRHDDVFLTRLSSGIAITVRGYSEGETARSVFFSQNLQQMKRLEWKDGNTVAGWNFSQFGKSIWDKALLPKRADLDVNGQIWVVSEILSVKTIRDRALFDAKNAWKTASKTSLLSGNLESAIKTLVTYR